MVGTGVGGPHWITRLAFDFVLTLHLHYLLHFQKMTNAGRGAGVGKMHGGEGKEQRRTLQEQAPGGRGPTSPDSGHHPSPL